MLTLTQTINLPNRIDRIRCTRVNVDADEGARVDVEVLGNNGTIVATHTLTIRDDGVTRVLFTANAQRIGDVSQVIDDRGILGALTGLRNAVDAAARANGGKRLAAETYLSSVGVLPAGVVA